MKVGLSAFAWTASVDKSHSRLFAAVREYGYEAFEIPMFDPSILSVVDLRREFEANDLDCTICGILPPGINPISPDAATRRLSLVHLSDCVKTAAELGAHVLGGPLFAPIGYLPGHRPTTDEWTWAVEAFQSLGDLLDESGITLAIEPVNRSETFFLRTALRARELCEAISHRNVGVTIDSFHANIEERRISDAMESLGSRLKHLHLSENDRGVLGSGHIDFEEILKAAASTNFKGYLVVEGFGFSRSEPTAPGALWADEGLSPETFAIRSINFLRGLFSS